MTLEAVVVKSRIDDVTVTKMPTVELEFVPMLFDDFGLKHVIVVDFVSFVVRHFCF